MTPRYRDIPPRGLAWLTTLLATTAFASAGGFALGFLALVFVGVAGVELDPMTWGSGVLDQMLRGTVGLTGIGFAACLGIGAALHGAHRLLYARQLAREAESSPTLVAAWQGRSVIASSSPFLGLTTFAWWCVGLGGLAVVLLLAASGGRSDESSSVWAALGIAVAVVVAMIGLLVHVSIVWRPAWHDARSRMLAAWGEAGRFIPWSSDEDPSTAKEDAAAEVATVGVQPRRLKRVARVTARVGAFAGIAGGAAFLLGLVLRKPCRGCDVNSYASFGETAIDVLMQISAVLTVLAAAVFVLAMVVEWIEDVVLQARLARLVRDGASAPPTSVLAAALTEPWPGSTAGIALVVVGLGLGGVFGFAEVVTPGVLQPVLVPVLLAVGMLGVLLIAWSVGAQARGRNRLREAWSVGDVRPARSPASAKRRRPRSAEQTQ